MDCQAEPPSDTHKQMSIKITNKKRWFSSCLPPVFYKGTYSLIFQLTSQMFLWDSIPSAKFPRDPFFLEIHYFKLFILLKISETPIAILALSIPNREAIKVIPS